MLTRQGIDLLDLRGPIAPWEYEYFLHAARMHEIRDEQRALRSGMWAIRTRDGAARWNDANRKLSTEFNTILNTFAPDTKRQEAAWAFLRNSGGVKTVKSNGV